MRLSEAIELGAKYKETRSEFLNIDGSCCAIGGAYRVMVNDICKTSDWQAEFWTNDSALFGQWPELELKATCPDLVAKLCLRNYKLFDVISHLHYYHRWSKQRIASWIAENFENKQSLEVEQNAKKEEKIISSVGK